MTVLLRPALSEYRSWIVDSRRWDGYRPRPDDIVIATNPKCGTTWTQRIVAMLVLQSAAPRPLAELSVWLDSRLFQTVEADLAQLAAQTHRRFLKSHLPLDGLPFYREVRYIHVARDGRDAFMSYHNHRHAFTPMALQRIDQIGLGDPDIARPYPRCPDDPRAWFRHWLDGRLDETKVAGDAEANFFALEASYWAERHQENVLLVHYNDLKADLEGEMRRIAGFLDIDIPPGLWPELVAAADFRAMRKDGMRLIPGLAGVFDEGPDRFIFKGTNGRWRDVLTEDDVAAYEARVRECLPLSCAHWLEAGRRVAGDPRDVP